MNYCNLSENNKGVTPKYEDLDDFLTFVDEEQDEEDELDDFLSIIDEED